MTPLPTTRFASTPLQVATPPTTPFEPPLRAVAFDLDGTLTDSAPGICATVGAALAEAGHPPPSFELVSAMIGLPLRDVIARVSPSVREDELDGLLARYKVLYAETVIPSTLLFPRAWSLLRACRAGGLKLALVTAKPTDVAHRVLARCRVRGLFDSVVGGDRAALPKPYPDLMRVALDELGVAPAETLLVGDGDHDVKMGASAGARTCGVAWGVHAAERLHAAGAEIVVHDVAALRDLILPRPPAQLARAEAVPLPAEVATRRAEAAGGRAARRASGGTSAAGVLVR